MANASIKSAFERLWEHTLVKLNTKSDKNHTHNYLELVGNNTISSTSADTTANWGGAEKQYTFL